MKRMVFGLMLIVGMAVYLGLAAGEGEAWTKQWGTVNDEVGQGVAVDQSGDVFVSGSTYGHLDGSINAGDADFFLTKFDSSGAKQWTRLLGTPGQDYAYGAAVDSSGNVYVTGHTCGNLDGNINAGAYDAVLVKFDSSGAKQWTRLLGTPGGDEGFSVAVESAGNIYITGATLGVFETNEVRWRWDGFLAKYDSSGARQWTRQLGSSLHASARGVAVDSSGNVYVTGYTYDDLDGNLNAGGYDIFLVKYDSSGTKHWTRLLGTGSDDVGIAVAASGSGDAYVTGYTCGHLDGNVGAGNDDIFLVKYDSSGTKQWTRVLGTPSDDRGVGVAVDQSRNVYVSGYTYGHLDGNINAGDRDIFLTKFDSSGTRQWTKLLGTPNDDYGTKVTAEAGASVYITGCTCGNLDGNVCAGGWDVFLTKFEEVTRVEIDIKPGSYPNSINLGSGGTVPVAIFSTWDFDARDIDPTTITLANAKVQLKGKGTPMASLEYVNNDGLLDLVVHVSTEAFQLSESDTTATLEGRTLAGRTIRGTDSVRIVP